MISYRVIPILLIKGNGLYKTVKFDSPKYVGDPINTAKIFNEKEVDELMILDITASKEKKDINYDLISQLTTECFIPLGYGGGITSYAQAEKLFAMGIEKISLNTSFFKDPSLARSISDAFGVQAVTVSIDIKKNFFGKTHVYVESGSVNTKMDPVEYAKKAESMGAGEILINSIDRDGMMQGYDLELVKKVADAVQIPVVACGGAGSLDHLKQAVQAGASAVSAGSYFVFQGKHKAVLISYPNRDELEYVFSQI